MFSVHTVCVCMCVAASTLRLICEDDWENIQNAANAEEDSEAPDFKQSGASGTHRRCSALTPNMQTLRVQVPMQ